MALSRDASAKEDSERGASEPILGTRVFDSDDGGSLSSAADGDDANEQNEVGGAQQLIRNLHHNMSSRRFRSKLASEPLQVHTPSETPRASASGGDGDGAGSGTIGRSSDQDVPFSETNSLPPVMLATGSGMAAQDSSTTPWAESTCDLERAMTARRRLSFAANLATANNAPPPREPPFGERGSNDEPLEPTKERFSLQSSQGASAPCCLWLCGRGAVAPEASDSSNGSRTSVASQGTNPAVPADLMPAIAKALRRARGQRGESTCTHMRSWQWWTSVTDVYTGKVIRLRRGHVLHPSCPLALAWNTYLNVLVGVLTIVLPLIAGFVIDNTALDTVRYLSYVSLLLDVLFGFVRGYRIGTTSDHNELRSDRVAVHYARTWFVYDLLVSLPWRSILPNLLGNHWVVSTPELKHALPLIVLGRVLTLQHRTSFFNAELLQIKHGTRSILKFASFVAISSHCMACAWMLMALVHISWFGRPENTWLETAGIDLERDSMLSQYMQCLYYSVTIMATIGFGDIVPTNGYERGLSIIAMVTGSWTYAYCITQAAEQIANMNLADSRFRAHQDLLIEYMAARNLPRELRSRLLAFYKFQRRHAAVFHREAEILQDLPPRLHAEVKAFSNADTCKTVKSMKLFRGFGDTILSKLIVSLRSQFLPPNEIVCMEGEMGRHTYLIRKGYLDVTVNGVRLAQLADGECFGERALISAHAKRRATVTTRTYCQLFLLSRTAVQAAFAAHPHSWATLCRRAEMQWHTYSKSRLPAEHARGYEDEAAAAGPGQAPFSLERSLPKSVNGSLGSVKAEGLETLVRALCTEVAELKAVVKSNSRHEADAADQSGDRADQQ